MLFKILRIILFTVSFYEIEIIEVMLGYSGIVFAISILLSLIYNLKKGFRVLVINSMTILGLLVISFAALSFTELIIEQQILASLVIVEIVTFLLKI